MTRPANCSPIRCLMVQSKVVFRPVLRSAKLQSDRLLGFGPSSGLPANVQEKLTASAAKSLKYFEGLGYNPKIEIINFNTKPKVENAASYYDDKIQPPYPVRAGRAPLI